MTRRCRPKLVKKYIGKLLGKIAPRTWTTIQSIRARRLITRLQHEWGSVDLAQRFIAAQGETVCGGPFAGMVLPYDPSFAGYISMLVGSLEEELAPAIQTILAKKYKSIANVGCAEGYYAVGLAMKIKTATIHAFDIDPWARRFCRKLALLNRVAERVRVHGWCDHAALNSILSQRALVVCDCEGYELELLNPAPCPALRNADILVELHDFAHPGGVTETIIHRFAATHQIERFEIQGRDASKYSSLAALPESSRGAAIAEHRSANSRWAWGSNASSWR